MKLLAGLLIVLAAFGAEAKPQHKNPIVTFSAKSFIVAGEDGHILREKDSDIVRPIASISKLMVTLLASEQDMSEELEVPAKRTVQSIIPQGTKHMDRRQLMTLALVRSDNFAAQILCENLPSCVEKMNEKAKELGMTHTSYQEPTGLSKENVSTATDLLKLLLVATNNPLLTEISSMPQAEIPINNKMVKFNNTNPLTRKLNIILSKTGFTNPAGGCLVMVANTALGKRIYVLLGSRNAHTRIPDMEKLVWNN
jgi:serine-type D-Ala-D-Ala endopeptidase (penicillin-binding protein 7)